MGSKWWKIAGGIGAAIGIQQGVARAREVDLAGQVALITGSTSGLGLQMARELAGQGCRVVICGRDEDKLERAGEQLSSQGAAVLAVRCDVSDVDDVQRLVDATIEEYGRIDLLICNAGVIQVGQFRSMELENFRQAMETMYFGTLHPILAALPHMRKQGGGRIALVTSIGGVVSVPYLLPYNASKFAAVGLGEGLRAELQDEGITVTTIVLGLMRTGSYVNALFSGDEQGRESAYRVFSALSSLPLLTGDAEAAARSFIRAIRRGDASVIYPPQYNLVARLHGLAPATTMALMGIADRLMPRSGTDASTVRGEAIDADIPANGIWRALTASGRDAISRLQAHSDAGEET